MILVDPLPYEAWLRWRELGLGGSDADTIMGTSKWETPKELWQRRTARLAAKKQTPAMSRGKRLEAFARDEYERITGIPMPAQLGIHDVHEWLRASFDGYNFEEKRAIEIKCPGKEDHQAACAGRIPGHYLWQLVHLLLVSDLPVIDYVSFDEHTIAIIPFKRDLALEARLIKMELQFWQYIKNDVEPPTAAELLARRGIVKSVADRIFPVRARRTR